MAEQRPRPGASTLDFAQVARVLGREARARGLHAPGFRCPPRIVGVDRSLRRTGEHVTVFARPGVSVASLAEARRFLRRPVKLATVSAEEFDKLLQKTYEGVTGATAALATGLKEENVEADDLSAALAEAQDLLESDDDAPIIKFINGLLVEAIKENASDIHVETYERGITVRFRVDGVLREVISAPKQLAPKIVSRIKIMARLDIA